MFVDEVAANTVKVDDLADTHGADEAEGAKPNAKQEADLADFVVPDHDSEAGSDSVADEAKGACEPDATVSMDADGPDDVSDHHSEADSDYAPDEAEAASSSSSDGEGKNDGENDGKEDTSSPSKRRRTTA